MQNDFPCCLKARSFCMVTINCILCKNSPLKVSFAIIIQRLYVNEIKKVDKDVQERDYIPQLKLVYNNA